MKLKWWQWGLVGFGGLAVLNAALREAQPQPAASATAPEFAELDPAFREIGRGMWAMTFDAGVDPDTLPAVARERCGSLTICNVYGWVEPEYAARGFPFTEREVSRQVFVYSVNRNTGFEQALWDCQRWARPANNQCVSR